MELRDPGNAFPKMACDQRGATGVDRATPESWREPAILTDDLEAYQSGVYQSSRTTEKT